MEAVFASLFLPYFHDGAEGVVSVGGKSSGIEGDFAHKIGVYDSDDSSGRALSREMVDDGYLYCV